MVRRPLTAPAENADASAEPVPRAGRAESWLGWWAAILTTGAAVGAWVTVLVVPGAPPRSGPNCTATDGSCLTYPYTQASAFVPNDFVWMVPAFLLGPLLVVVLAGLLHDVPAPRRLPARIAQTSAVVAAAILTVDYYVQFTTVQASLVRGEVDAGLSLLSQYNPHGLFVAMEDLGYATMLVAFLFSARAIDGDSRPARALRWVLGVSGTLGVVMFVALVAVLGRDLEYWFEITGLALSWITLIPAGVLAAVILRPADGIRAFQPQDYSARRDYRPPTGWYRRINAVLGVPLTCLGFAPVDAVVLEVPGRTTGRLRRIPVLVTAVDADRYLVALAGQSQWVRNVRAAGGRVRLCRRGRRTVVLEEVPVAHSAPVLLAYLRRNRRGDGDAAASRQARYYFGVRADPTPAELQAIAGYYPVFRITEPEGCSPDG